MCFGHHVFTSTTNHFHLDHLNNLMDPIESPHNVNGHQHASPTPTPPLSPHDSQLISQWLATVQLQQQQHQHPPESHLPSTPSLAPNSLITTSTPTRLLLGTGHSLTHTAFLPTLLSATHSVLLVTCFWSLSSSQRLLSTALRQLSSQALAQGRIIRVRICFSSVSLWQKLTQTSSPQGKQWSSGEWARKLGLPRAEELGGLEVRVKSLFRWPVGVVHEKYLVVDGRVAWVGSWNVSWEDWGEGGVEVEGDVVRGLVRWWKAVWAEGEEGEDAWLGAGAGDDDVEAETRLVSIVDVDTAASSSSPLLPSSSPVPPSVALPISPTKTPTLLPSTPSSPIPHFHPFTSQPPTPPPTPLNLFLPTAFTHVNHSIYIITPNLTSPPVLSALLSALARGVAVTIITNRRMMLLEQLVTAGTITECCVANLVRRYKKMVHAYRRHLHASSQQDISDIEASAHTPIEPGTLKIAYYKPGAKEAPRKLHLKLSIFDEHITVLGSGNMDRASWFTSWELGVVFFEEEIAKTVRRGVEGAWFGGEVEWVCGG